MNSSASPKYTKVTKTMLTIALPNKGSLSEEAARLMSEAGYACKRHNKELHLYDKTHDIDFIFLRPRDIAIYVSRGILDIGITGRDLAREACVEVKEILPLGFGKSKFRYAVPADSTLTPDDFDGLRIASSYPNLVKSDMKKRSCNVEVIPLDGAVEISVKLGVADAIADVVESGRTLTQAGLKVVGEPLLESEAIVITQNNSNDLSPQVQVCLQRLRGIIAAREYLMIEYDIPEALLVQACDLTPGIESPTISPLSKPGWLAVKSMAKRKGINGIMDELATLGATGIIVSDILACRL
jgi:ATP phosphoribosyltransferase